MAVSQGEPLVTGYAGEESRSIGRKGGSRRLSAGSRFACFVFFVSLVVPRPVVVYS
jgi:hypothetical protein